MYSYRILRATWGGVYELFWRRDQRHLSYTLFRQRPREGSKSCRMGRNFICLYIPPWLALSPCWVALRPLYLALRV